MHEYGIPPEDHQPLPEGFDLEQQFPFALGTVGDFAAESVQRTLGLRNPQRTTSRDDILFSAQVLQAYDASQLGEALSYELRLLASAGFYLAGVPGSSMVLLRRLFSLPVPQDDPMAIAVRVALDRPWEKVGVRVSFPIAVDVLRALRDHFQNGGGADALTAIRKLRDWAYETGSPHELLMADILAAVTIQKIKNSSWTLLPGYSGLGVQQWLPYLSRADSTKEMWPSQRMLGEAGLYRGQSGVVQMPTSAGKTHATQLILRAAFLSGRTKLAIVIAPFRALCYEIAQDLQAAFAKDAFLVNQLSDALQPDFAPELKEFLDIEIDSTPHVIVLTPEKLLYVLRQESAFVEKLGLVIYDEGHQFDTGARGVTYELLLTSIKRLLPKFAQTVLISAVIENAPQIAKWLISDESKVVKSDWLQTNRLVAFASFPPEKDGQLLFNVDNAEDLEFSIPKAIVVEELNLRGAERTPRVFPTRESGSVALYLALRLAANGGVAIYSGTKLTAAKIVRDAATEIFSRGVSLPTPAQHSDAGEIQRFRKLYTENFGPESYLTQACAIGIFAHHGNTPHGLRLAIEHAMRRGLIRLIVCTSTLAQGVNLPIRYLLVTSAMQGQEKIRTRDFHNLMGRAGRAGMYGEGTIVFTNSRLYDERKTESRRWESALALLRPDSAESTGSTLLELLAPMTNDTGARVITSPTPFEVAIGLVNGDQDIYASVSNLPAAVRKNKFSSQSLLRQLATKKRTVEAVESFLMTYRGELDLEAFASTARSLATETLAHSLAGTDEQRTLLEDVFEAVARRVDEIMPDLATQKRFGRSLLGLDHAMIVESWVGANFQELSSVESVVELFDRLWPLFLQICPDKRLKNTEPTGALHELARGWLQGTPFAALLTQLNEAKATIPHGEQRRKFNIDVVVDLCEHCFGYEFPLLLSCVRLSFDAACGSEDDADDFDRLADLLQKRLKYGLPNQDTVSYFEAGFSERVVAQEVANAIFWELANSAADAKRLVQRYRDDVEAILHGYPSFFEATLREIVT
ncbi:DEAD/DEAH box helicase [Ralstonia pseudosolanacearum]|uniref:DEAD/DEAH box helicase n=1 Tax=Ralstonia pseudosolanacearum TaxID=1310165 RepID=UPI001C8C37DA|nr:DEAD/DEAH box helicase [Ralstonia pseudosolanacearum]MBX9432365.1 DEAD/DEAH box helicase [Ralstonia pseudosolanacearum]